MAITETDSWKAHYPEAVLSADELLTQLTTFLNEFGHRLETWKRSSLLDARIALEAYVTIGGDAVTWGAKCSDGSLV
jgi:hypothetical protein